jgi:hypothetical protein
MIRMMESAFGNSARFEAVNEFLISHWTQLWFADFRLRLTRPPMPRRNR